MTANSLPVRRYKQQSKALRPSSLRRAMCAEYMRDFNLERVAEMFDTTEDVVRRVINSKDMQRHLSHSLGETAHLDVMAGRRLLEALLEEALQDADTKDSLRARTEARKILARHYLPKKTENENTHRYFIETPSKMEQDDWERKYGNGVPIQEADYEVIVEDGDQKKLTDGGE